MALVSGIGTIYPHEHARIHPIPGKSRHVKVLGVTTWEDFPLAALAWWEKQYSWSCQVLCNYGVM